jgi:DNA-binding LacI/PurR family transcriptional regulator
LLVFAASLEDVELVHLYEMDFPVVLLHQSPPDGMNIPYVTIENKAGARELVNHLIEVHAYRRIAFLRGPENHEDSYWRELGYREALESHDIPFDPALVATGGFDKEIAQFAIEQWLQQGAPIDAVFAGDDEAATGVIAALQRAGKRVPEDFAVVGFDDVHLADYLMPPLTTVRAPIEQTGREAVRQLVSLLRTGEADPLVLLPTELVIRRSCGCEGGLERSI